jgi:hypothetical protein
MASEKQDNKRRQYIQPKLRVEQQVNDAFGDNILNDSDLETIYFQNINGIKDEKNWTQSYKR